MGKDLHQLRRQERKLVSQVFASFENVHKNLNVLALSVKIDLNGDISTYIDNMLALVAFLRVWTSA